ncbi:MAG: hypothetical protein HY673_03580 [Chloroflexi bacterium]|nr:hypothetical protein [Chloroflexota bacterium]
MNYPLWATPPRRAKLVRLFDQCGGLCVHGHRPCPDPEHHYEYFIDGIDAIRETRELIEEPVLSASSETGFVISKVPVPVLRKVHLPGLIDEWKAEDRNKTQAEWKRERRLMHQITDRKGWGRRFDPIAREQFLLSQPPYQLEGVGVSGLTFTRVAKVRIASTNVRLFVDVAKSKPLSKNQRRKLTRYGIRPEHETIDELCKTAVSDYWDKV